MESPVTDAERLRLRERPAALPLMRQRWQDLAFLHWSVDPIALSALLPPGIELDTWQGKAYVGIVPFRVRRSRATFLPPIPGTADFDELNLRTYVHRRGRDPGVWFFSLDATSHLAVWGARAVYKLPYFHASIAMMRSEQRTTFSSLRTGDQGRAHFACSYEPASAPGAVAPGTLEFFLIERYLLYSWDGRRLRKARVWHRPYPVAAARIDGLSETVAAAKRIEIAPDIAPIAHCAEMVDVRIYPPSLVRSRRDQRAAALSVAPELSTADAALGGAVAAVTTTT
jgi:hypothetical protein